MKFFYCKLNIRWSLSQCRPVNSKRPGTWRRFSLRELHAATYNFNYDNKLGEGIMGSVYWGQLASGDQVCQNQIFWRSVCIQLSTEREKMITLTCETYKLSSCSADCREEVESVERQGRERVCCGDRDSRPSSTQAPAEPAGLLCWGPGALDCVWVHAPLEPLRTLTWPHCCRLHLDVGAAGEDRYWLRWGSCVSWIHPLRFQIQRWIFLKKHSYPLHLVFFTSLHLHDIVFKVQEYNLPFLIKTVLNSINMG